MAMLLFCITAFSFGAFMNQITNGHPMGFILMILITLLVADPYFAFLEGVFQ